MIFFFLTDHKICTQCSVAFHYSVFLDCFLIIANNTLSNTNKRKPSDRHRLDIDPTSVGSMSNQCQSEDLCYQGTVHVCTCFLGSQVDGVCLARHKLRHIYLEIGEREGWTLDGPFIWRQSRSHLYIILRQCHHLTVFHGLKWVKRHEICYKTELYITEIYI